MHHFRIWAPRATRMQIQVAGRKYEMTGPVTGPENTGWWEATVEDAQPGDDYGYLVSNKDGDDPHPWPDPRSNWQPHGVHGLSRLYDQKAFRWRDQAWQGPPLAGAVIYEMHIGTFTREGTFDSAVTKLDQLAALGVTHIEVMPVCPSPGNRGWGYDGVSLFAVTETYGGPDAFKRFVDACHNRGLAVLLDVVYNHFGPVGNYTGRFGPYVTDRHHTPWGDAINFEAEGSDHVRRFFIDNALMWMCDFHCDGLRLDAVHEFVDRSAVHFMEQLTAEVETASAMHSRHFVLIAESDLNDPRVVTPREAGGYGMDAQWSDDFHHALFAIITPTETGGYYDDFGSFDQLVKCLTTVFVYDGIYSKYRHRRHGRPVSGLSAHRFVGFIQNHDQVGNRAVGDRLEQIVGFDKAKVAAGIVLTAPFIPMLFQGEEFAASTPFQFFADHDPEIAKLVSAGRKKEFAAFGWDPGQIPDPEDPRTFERSKLNWDESAQGKHAEMLDWYTKLIHIRRSSPSLNDGDTGHIKVRYDAEKHWIVIDRGQVEIVANLGPEPAGFDIPQDYRIVAQSHTGIALTESRVTLPSDTLAILSCEQD